MTLMSRKVDYALLILAYLHLTPQGGCARGIAEQFGLSRPFVANILKELCRKEFVTSRRGPHGGYALQRPAEQINLAELIEAIDDPMRFAQPSPDLPAEPRQAVHGCPIRGAIAEIHGRIREMLRGVTLAEVLRPAAPAEALQVGLDLFPHGKIPARC